jgi:uncharacterized membrane protein YdjX (TVP38/TMEM64 family)
LFEAERVGDMMRYMPVLVIVVAAIVGGYFLSDFLSFETLAKNRFQLLEFRDANFTLSAVGFMCIYIVIVAFSLPGASVASITGGFLFGLAFGTLLNVMSASIGAFIIFLAVRMGIGRALSDKIDTSEGKLAQLRARLRENEVSVLFLLRLVPVVPFFVANVLPALVGARVRNFLITTVLGIIPGGLVYTWIGVGIGDVFDRGETPDFSIIWSPHIIGPIVGLIILAALPMVIGKKGQ